MHASTMNDKKQVQDKIKVLISRSMVGLREMKPCRIEWESVVLWVLLAWGCMLKSVRKTPQGVTIHTLGQESQKAKEFDCPLMSLLLRYHNSALGKYENMSNC